MYRGFQLELSSFNFKSYKTRGEQIYAAHEKAIRPLIDQFTSSNGVLNGSDMQDEWFPDFDADIFISHAHADRDLALSLAGWLQYKFGLTAFIDSGIWGYASDLLWDLDNKYCKFEGQETFDYQKRNYSTAHVHMMLNNALTKMIDQCECILFLRTPESTVQSIIETKTNSPWLYSEISTTRTIRKRMPDRLFLLEFMKAGIHTRKMNESAMPELNIQYLLDVNHLQELSDDDIRDWSNLWNRIPKLNENALDNLYHLKPVE